VDVEHHLLAAARSRREDVELVERIGPIGDITHHRRVRIRFLLLREQWGIELGRVGRVDDRTDFLDGSSNVRRHLRKRRAGGSGQGECRDQHADFHSGFLPERIS
jgi:hypothetical protein